MLALEGDDQAQGTPQAQCWLLRSLFPLQSQHGYAEEFCRAKSKTPKWLQIWCTHLYLPKTSLLYPAGTIKSAAGNATLLVVELKQMQRIPEDFNKILTARSVLMHRVIQNFHWHWCCRYGYKNYNYTDHVLNETVTLPPLQQPQNSSIAS